MFQSRSSSALWNCASFPAAVQIFDVEALIITLTTLEAPSYDGSILAIVVPLWGSYLRSTEKGTAMEPIGI